MSGYEARFAARKDELEWLYKELYGDNRWYLDQLENTLAGYARERPLDLRHLDDAREAHPGWYLSGNSLEVKAHVRTFRRGSRDHAGENPLSEGGRRDQSPLGGSVPKPWGAGGGF
ncbi:MAG: hypothetical protein LKE39_10875 [Sphaerochaeta sp.]|nr:hypothetical protein [Sphaerochaeta sp.]